MRRSPGTPVRERGQPVRRTTPVPCQATRERWGLCLSLAPRVPASVLRDRDGSTCGVAPPPRPIACRGVPMRTLTGANLVDTKLLHANFPDAILSRTLHWARYRRRVDPLLADMDGHTLKVRIAASMTPSSSELVYDEVPQGRNFAF